MGPNNLDIAKVKLSTHVNYHCTMCGDCCRHVEASVIMESMDVFRLARFFRETGQPGQTMEEVLNTYTDSFLLSEDMAYPVFALKTVGPDQSCVFLKDNRCSIQAVKPRTCRLYPFTVDYEPDTGKFIYYICREKPHHFTGGVTLVNDWMHENFTKEDREYVRLDFEQSKRLGLLMRRVKHLGEQAVLTPLIYYKYCRFNLDEPFFPQYRQNSKQLLRDLEGLAGLQEPGSASRG